MRYLILLFFLLPCICQADDIDRLINAIAIVESDACDYPKGSNDNGLAKGRYQIHQDYWTDGVEFLRVDWPYSDAHNPVKAKQVVRAYFNRYGKNLSIEQLAKLHNDGPNWKRKDEVAQKKLNEYWKKVKGELK